MDFREDGSRESEALKEECRELREIQGLDFKVIAERTGVAYATLQTWAKRHNWNVPRIINHVLSRKITVKANTPSVQSALNAFYKQDTQAKEKGFDEHLHDIACAVPLIIKQMPVDEWVSKADKISKLVQMAREVLGKTGEKREQRPPVSISILSANCPPSIPVKQQVVELEQLTQTSEEG
jgi:hypothetical protein